MESDGFVGVENLCLTAGSLGWAVKWEVAVAIGNQLSKVCVHLRAGGVTITVIDVHGYE